MPPSGSDPNQLKRMVSDIRSFLTLCALTASFFFAAFYGVLTASAVHHGWDSAFWPASAISPTKWIELLQVSNLRELGEELAAISNVYLTMALGRHAGFPGGGALDFWIILAGSLWLALLPSC